MRPGIHTSVTGGRRVETTTPVPDIPTSAKRSRGVELPVEPDTIRTELRRRGMTLDTLARRARVSRPHLSNAMAGRFRLSQGET